MRQEQFLEGLLLQKLVCLEMFLFPAISPFLLSAGFSVGEIYFSHAISLGLAAVTGLLLPHAHRCRFHLHRLPEATLALVIVASGTCLHIADHLSFYLARAAIGIAVGLLQPLVIVRTLGAGTPTLKFSRLGKLEVSFALTTLISVPLAIWVTQAYGWTASFWLILFVASVCLAMRLRNGALVFEPTDCGPRPRARSLALQRALPSILVTMSGQVVVPLLSILLMSSYGVSASGLAVFYALSGPLGLIATSMIGKLLDRSPIETVFWRVAIASAMISLCFTCANIASPVLGILLGSAFGALLTGRKMALIAWYSRAHGSDSSSRTLADLSLMSSSRNITMALVTLISAQWMALSPEASMAQWSSHFGALSALLILLAAAAMGAPRVALD